MVTVYSYDRRATSYTTLYYDLVETLRKLRDEYQADPRLVGMQALHALGSSRQAGKLPYHKLYFHLTEVLAGLKDEHGEDPRRILQQALETLKREKPRLAGGPWTWKPVPGPPGTGYVTQNGRAVLHKDGPKKWVLTLDRRDHAINSRSPGFGHAEHILQRELGPDYADAR